VLLQTAHPHPNTGTPAEVPVPKNLKRILPSIIK